MNTSTSQFDVLARIDDELSDLTARLSTVANDVRDLRLSLTDDAPLPAADPEPAPAPQYPAAHCPAPQYPPVQYPPVQYPPAQLPPRPAVRDRLTGAVERGLIGKILAFAGVAITLIGVVLLLVLAAQAGLLRPELRVAGGAVGALLLVALGVRIGRDAAKRSGAIGLVATGIAAGLFDVLAAANIYHWLPEIGALILTSAIAATGFVIAARWDKQSLGVAVGLALVLLAPALTRGVTVTLIVFLLVYAASTLAVQVGRDWTGLFAVNTLATTAPLIALLFAPPSATPLQFGGVAALCLTLAFGSSIVLLRSGSEPLLLALLGVAPVLVFFGAGEVLTVPTTAIVLAVIAGVLTVAATVGGRLPGAVVGVRVVWLATALVAVLVAVGLRFGDDGAVLALLGVALVLALAVPYAGSIADPMRILATVAWVFGLFILLPRALDQLIDADPYADPVFVMIAVLLALGSLVAGTMSWLHATPNNRRLVLGAGLLGLLLFNVLCVAVGDAVTGGSDNGFYSGHMIATIGFVAAGATALMWARRLDGADRTMTLIAGLAVIAAAVAKLFVFDLAALDGLFRVIAFIVVGLVLLGLGVPYAQSLTAPTKEPSAPR